VDLALQYAVDVWGIPLNAIPSGNAIDWSRNQHTHIRKEYGTWVQNSSSNIAPQGAIIVFNISSCGHIAIVDSADKHNVTVIEQNAGGHADTKGIFTNNQHKVINQQAVDCVRRNTYINYRHVVGWYEKKAL
jgi:surface antigen